MDRRNMTYIALDIGNVLCNVNEKEFIEFVSYKLNISTFKAKRFLKRFQQLHDLGFTTMEDELMDQLNVNSPLITKEIVDKWNNAISPSYPMLSMIHELKNSNNLKIALLSNIGVEHASIIDSKLHGLGGEIIKHLSCFVGARKPSSLYFQSFLLQHPEFTNCIYVDDLQANLDGAAPLGFRTFRFSLAEPDVSSKMEELRHFIKSSNNS